MQQRRLQRCWHQATSSDTLMKPPSLKMLSSLIQTHGTVWVHTLAVPVPVTVGCEWHQCLKALCHVPPSIYQGCDHAGQFEWRTGALIEPHISCLRTARPIGHTSARKWRKLWCVYPDWRRASPCCRASGPKVFPALPMKWPFQPTAPMSLLHLGKFNLLRSPSQVALFSSAFEHLWLLRTLILDTVRRISIMNRTEGHHDDFHRRLAWMRSTWLTATWHGQRWKVNVCFVRKRIRHGGRLFVTSCNVVLRNQTKYFLIPLLHRKRYGEYLDDQYFLRVYYLFVPV